MNKLCPCGREASGFAYDPRLAGVSADPPIASCSYAHLKIISQAKGRVADMALTDTENMAVMNAGPIIGEYLENMRVTDFREMSYEEYMDAIAKIFDACLEERGKLFEAKSGGVPF